MSNTDDQREAWYAAQQQGASAGVRILKRGSPPEEELHRGTCHRCGTEIEFKRGVATFHDDQRDGAFLSIPCPVCASVINVSLRAGRTRRGWGG